MRGRATISVTALLLLLTARGPAQAQEQAELFFGPEAYNRAVGRLAFTVWITSGFKIGPQQGLAYLRARVIADLSGLQQQLNSFSKLLNDGSQAARDCQDANLTFDNDTLRQDGDVIGLLIRGYASVWRCETVTTSFIEWQKKKIALGLTTQVPVSKTRTELRKTKEHRAEFEIQLKGKIERNDDKVSFVFTRENVQMLDAVDSPARSKLDRIIDGAVNQLNGAVEGIVNLRTLEHDYVKLKPELEKTVLFEEGGRLKLQLNLSAPLSSDAEREWKDHLQSKGKKEQP